MTNDSLALKKKIIKMGISKLINFVYTFVLPITALAKMYTLRLNCVL